MAWSKVNKPFEKPVKWWYHKLLCEFWWHISYNGNHISKYYFHLGRMVKQGYNIYGSKIINID